MSTELPPPLLRIYQATGYLGINRSQLQNLYPHLHVLQMPHHSRRLATPYVHGFLDHYPTSRYERRVYAAREFAGTLAAHRAIQDAEAALEAVISESLTEIDEAGLAISALDMAAALNLQRSSITDWKRSGALETFPHDGQLYIAEAALRGAVSWQRPEDYDPLKFEEIAAQT
jgi:hypothetical protein